MLQNEGTTTIGKEKTYSFNLCRCGFKKDISFPKCLAGSNPMAATYCIKCIQIHIECLLSDTLGPTCMVINCSNNSEFKLKLLVH
jgi:hypothetical protein